MRTNLKKNNFASDRVTLGDFENPNHLQDNSFECITGMGAFYYGDDITSFSDTTQQWEDYHSLQSYGQGPVVIWDAPTGSPNEPKKPEIKIINSPNLKFSGGVEIKFS